MLSPVGQTALWIAAARALETESADPLFTDPFARALAGDDGFALFAAMREASGAASRGPDPYLSIRTRFLDDALQGVVRDRGLKQIVMLAAGMDTRAFRLEWPAGVAVFEVDRDDVFDFKEPILGRLNASATCDRRVVRVDLTSDWVSALTAAGFDRERPAAFLLEGLVMYLQQQDADRLFDIVASLAAEGSWIGLDTVNAELLTSPYTSGAMKQLADLGCPWTFSMSDPEGYLARHKWRITVVAPGDPEARYHRWPFPAMPRSVPNVPRIFFVVGSNDQAERPRHPGPISIATAGRYEWGAGCEGWHLVTTDALSVIQEKMPPGTSEVRHRHIQALQFFRVLSGCVDIEVDGETHRLEAGTGLEVRPRVPHQVFNRGSMPAEFLVISQPPSHDDREVVTLGN